MNLAVSRGNVPRRGMLESFPVMDLLVSVGPSFSAVERDFSIGGCMPHIGRTYAGGFVASVAGALLFYACCGQGGGESLTAFAFQCRKISRCRSVLGSPHAAVCCIVFALGGDVCLCYGTSTYLSWIEAESLEQWDVISLAADGWSAQSYLLASDVLIFEHPFVV